MPYRRKRLWNASDEWYSETQQKTALDTEGLSLKYWRYIWLDDLDLADKWS